MHPLTGVLLAIYVLLVGIFIISVIANHHHPEHVPGPQGKEGIFGIPGFTGSQGDVGNTGPTGGFITDPGVRHGMTGPTGPVTGPTGPVGFTGYYGITGPTGPQTGATGQQGPRGVSAISGLTGPTGDIGARGSTGPTGPSTSGPTFLNVLYSYTTNFVGPTGASSTPVSDPPMLLLQTLPTPIPPEFTLAPTGSIVFNNANTSYLVRIGVDLAFVGLTGSWQPTTVSLVNFPSPPGMPLMTMWPALVQPGTAVASLGATVVYKTSSSVPVVFQPQIVVSISDFDAFTSLTISLLSITIEHAAP